MVLIALFATALFRMVKSDLTYQAKLAIKFGLMSVVAIDHTKQSCSE